MRVTTGIEGFDELIEGGFVPGATVIVGGKAGTGKSLFCSQFLYTGAKRDEHGCYVTLEERAEDIVADLKETFGWDFDELQKKKLIKFVPLRIRRVYHPIEKKVVLTKNAAEISKEILEAVDSIKAKRLVIDSVSVVDMMFEDKFQSRSELVAMLDGLKTKGVTTLLIKEVPESGIGTEFLSFLADAVIRLDALFTGREFQRTLLVKKMRRTEHSPYIHPFVITKKGLQVKKV